MVCGAPLYPTRLVGGWSGSQNSRDPPYPIPDIGRSGGIFGLCGDRYNHLPSPGKDEGHVDGGPSDGSGAGWVSSAGSSSPVSAFPTLRSQFRPRCVRKGDVPGNFATFSMNKSTPDVPPASLSRIHARMFGGTCARPLIATTAGSVLFLYDCSRKLTSITTVLGSTSGISTSLPSARATLGSTFLTGTSLVPCGVATCANRWPVRASRTI